MVNSEHVLLMDASADNLMVKAFVDQVGKERSAGDSAPPRWVRNRYVRLNNDAPEVIEVIVNRASGKAAKHALIQSGIEKVMALLKEGKRVVVACSTKKTVELLLAEYLALNDPSIIAAFYTSDKKHAALLKEHIGDVNTQ